MDGMKKTLPRDVQALHDLFSFIAEFVRRERLSSSVQFSLDLVMEELFVNTVRYHPENPNDISIRLERKQNAITVTLVDHDVKPFDITKKGAYDTTKPIEERDPGGIGIHLVHRMMDRVNYEYKNRNSIITLTKFLENADVSSETDR